MIPSVLAADDVSRPIPVGGRYTVLKRLATGGMAEIYLARQAALAGFEKEIVIKRLRPDLATDPRVIDMFLDEARIGAILNHPNIVHVYDVDDRDGVPYIAMELIHGEELNVLCRRGLGVGKFLPIEHAVELIRQAAAGMGYFHAKRATWEGGDGAPLDIVHCDISPSNLLVTQDGFLKIIDFGIARARGQRFRAEGVIPGKLSYMAPEQAARQPIDHRSDIFSLGVVLYEITVGRRLFKGSAQEVVARLTSGQIQPPTFIRRDFPPALEAIVMRALELHPSDRYQSAYDLADDLEAFLRDERLHSGPVRIARYLDEVAAAEGKSRRPELIAESAGDGDELNFDAGVFAGYQAAGEPGAPGREWEDDEQPEADVAAALGIDLDELRAMRTPVPGAEDDDLEASTLRGATAVPARPDPAFAGAPPAPSPALTPPPPLVPMGTKLPLPPPTSSTGPGFPAAPDGAAPAMAAPATSGPIPRVAGPVTSGPVPRPAAPLTSGPVIGASITAQASRGAPWALVVLLALIAIGLLVYVLL
jgi:hypothetical protein